HKYAYVRCAVFGLGLGATREHTRQSSVSEEQQRPKPNTAQPSGRQVFLRQTLLLAPYRPLTGMLVARASSGTKIPCRERMRIYELEYLAPPKSARGSFSDDCDTDVALDPRCAFTRYGNAFLSEPSKQPRASARSARACAGRKRSRVDRGRSVHP